MRRRRRRTPTPATAKQARDFELAGQQPLPGFTPLPQTGSIARVREQALAVTEHTAKIIHELPSALASSTIEPPLIPEAAPPAKRPVTLLEVLGHAGPWIIMAIVVSIVVFRAPVAEVAYAVKLTGVPRPVIVGFLAWVSLPVAAIGGWLLWRRFDSAIPAAIETITRISRAFAIICVLAVAQTPTFITWTQSHEAAHFVFKSIKRAVVNALTMPEFGPPEVKPEPPRRR